MRDVPRPGKVGGSSPPQGVGGPQVGEQAVGKRTLVQQAESDAPGSRTSVAGGERTVGTPPRGSPQLQLKRGSPSADTGDKGEGGQSDQGDDGSHGDKRPGDQTTEINATIVPGSQFTGTGRAHEDPTAVVARANNDMREAGRQFADALQRAEFDGERYRYTLRPATEGMPASSFTIRIEAVPLPYRQVARSRVNTEKRTHVIQLSSRLADDQIKRALVHELSEIIAETRAADANQIPAHDDALRPGAFIEGTRLSFHDMGRVAELRLLTQQLASAEPAAVRQLRSEIAALVEHLGLRQGSDGARERMQLVAPALGPAAATLKELAQPVGNLAPDDHAALAEIHDTAHKRDHAPLAENREPLRPGPLPDASPDRIDARRARQLALDARAERQAKSRQTVRWLIAQSEAARQSGLPLFKFTGPVQIGGGAATAALTSRTLFIDNSDRWQRDPSPELAQTVGQVPSVRRTNLGNPHQFAPANERLPMHAIHLWEDTAAAKALVVDGQAQLHMVGDRLVLGIAPREASDPIVIQLSGTPAIATGFPTERLPGAIGMTPARAVATVRAGIEAVHHSESQAAMTEIGPRRGNDDREVIEVVEVLNRHPQLLEQLQARDGDLPEALATLRRFGDWGAKRARTPGRLVRGDEANLDTFDPMVTDSWIIAGTGGTALSAAENILARNPRATVHMVGRNAPPGLEENTQWRAIERRYKDRFSFEFGTAVGEVKSIEGSDPKDDRYVLNGKPAGGYVAALGRDGTIPGPMAQLVQQQMERDPASVRGALLFGSRQYLGYRITVRGAQDFDVIGAASRFLPPELFSDTEAKIVTTAGRHDAPSESGSFDGGFDSSVNQSHAYAMHKRAGTIEVIESSHVPKPPVTGVSGPKL